MEPKSSVLLLLAITLGPFDVKWGSPSGASAAPPPATGRLIFEDNFDSYDPNRWSREVKIPLEPDYEFCVFHKHRETLDVDGGVLRIRPSLFEDDYGPDSVYLGQLRLADCSSTVQRECQQHASSYHILPPIVSAKLVTRNHFEFRYGAVEVRAKFPEGDWLYPEIWLEPLYKSYDRRHANARIDLGRVRGNSALTKAGNVSDDYSSRLLEFGVGNGTGAEFRESLVSRLAPRNAGWNKAWHTYRTTWSSRGFVFHVDGEEVGRLTPTADGWSSAEDAEPDKMTPFDEKYYLSIGLGVGGIRVFPDNTQTNSYVKPWKNVNAKAMLLFWQARAKWLPSWQRFDGQKTWLEVDYVKIWDLD